MFKKKIQLSKALAGYSGYIEECLTANDISVEFTKLRPEESEDSRLTRSLILTLYSLGIEYFMHKIPNLYNRDFYIAMISSVIFASSDFFVQDCFKNEEDFRGSLSSCSLVLNNEATRILEFRAKMKNLGLDKSTDHDDKVEQMVFNARQVFKKEAEFESGNEPVETISIFQNIEDFLLMLDKTKIIKDF